MTVIVRLLPALKSYLWGGTKLITQYGKTTDENNLSESWELSFHSDGLSVIASGENVGKRLCEVASRTDWGVKCNRFDFFPVMVKLIDTADNLSVQVHPSDDYALANEHQYGKTEMWHILDCDEGACLYLGFNRSITDEQLTRYIADGTIMQYLNTVPVKKGDTYFIPSGTVHAIGKGITLCEIQQNSSLTYRIYDFNRVDSSGKPRQLHIEKARKVINLDKTPVPSPTREHLLGKCEYFSAYSYCGERDFYYPDSFCSITITRGSAHIGDLSLNKGQTAFISATQPFSIRGDCTYIIVTVE